MKVSRYAFITLLAGSTNAHQALRVLSDEAPIPAEFSFSIQRIESNDPHAKSSKTSKSSKAENRVKDLEKAFPCLGSLVDQTVVDSYVEVDDTFIREQGLVSEAIGEYAGQGTLLRTDYDQDVTKSEMKKLCATKCEQVLVDCTIFQMAEQFNAEGDIRYICSGGFNKDSIAAQFAIENPVKQTIAITGSVSSNFSVFQKGGGELVLPKFKGCNVPVGDDVESVIFGCRVADPPEFCTPFLKQDSDFMKYIVPAVECTKEELGDDLKVQACLSCLAKAPTNCVSDSICDKDNVITKKCTDADTCSASGQDKECVTCGSLCPESKECVSKLQTALLCQLGAEPKFDSNGQFGSCLNSDRTDFGSNYLEDDYQCL